MGKSNAVFFWTTNPEIIHTVSLPSRLSHASSPTRRRCIPSTTATETR